MDMGRWTPFVVWLSGPFWGLGGEMFDGGYLIFVGGRGTGGMGWMDGWMDFSRW